MIENTNELREAEIDEQREAFENSCRDVVANLTGWDDIINGKAFAFDYDDVEYLNAWTDACWQSYIKGWKSRN